MQWGFNHLDFQYNIFFGQNQIYSEQNKWFSGIFMLLLRHEN